MRCRGASRSLAAKSPKCGAVSARIMAPLRASESEPLLPLTKDDEATAQLRDRVTTQYTTIALVSALLSAVSFAAFAQPPAIFPVAGAPPTPSGLQPPTPPPAPSVHHGIGGDTEWLADVVYAFATSYGVELVLHAIMTVLWHIYGIGAQQARQSAGRQDLTPVARMRLRRAEPPLLRSSRLALAACGCDACPRGWLFALTRPTPQRSDAACICVQPGGHAGGVGRHPVRK